MNLKKQKGKANRGRISKFRFSGLTNLQPNMPGGLWIWMLIRIQLTGFVIGLVMNLMEV